MSPNQPHLLRPCSEATIGKTNSATRQSQARLGVGHTTFYGWIKTGKHGLKPPVQLGPKSVGHPEDEIDDVVDALIAERDRKLAAPGNKPPKAADRKHQSNRK